MKRLLLISPVSPRSLMGGGFFFRMPSLGLLRVAALTPPGWEVLFRDEKFEAIDFDMPVDLVGITSMTTTVQRGYEVADEFRRRGVKVAMGGMHVSALPEEALQHCDAVVVGEAETLWPRLIRDFEAGVLERIYDHRNGFPVLAGLPAPNWEMYRDKKYLPVHFVETTRGCPIDCEFCAVSRSFGGTYRTRPLDEVFAELDSLRPFEGRFVLRNSVLFVDDNIVGNRAYARQFLARLKDRKFRWFAQSSINIAKDPELLALCRDSGCVGIFIGFESLSPETLSAVGKRVNRPDEYLDAVRRIQDHGIGIDGSFVFGFDTDDDGVFDRTVEFATKAKIEVIYFSILTPYPGTRLYTRLEKEGRLLTRDWSLYDANHVVFRPKRWTPEQLEERYRAAFMQVYSIPGIMKRLWGTRAWKNFFYPMNFGFRHSLKRMVARG